MLCYMSLSPCPQEHGQSLYRGLSTAGKLSVRSLVKDRCQHYLSIEPKAGYQLQGERPLVRG